MIGNVRDVESGIGRVYSLVSTDRGEDGEENLLGTWPNIGCLTRDEPEFKFEL